MNREATARAYRGGRQAAPVGGCGVGLRDQHLPQVLEHSPPVPWFELLADNYLAPGYAERIGLLGLRERYPFTLHCVGMDLGGVDDLDYEYLKAVRRLMDLLQPAWVSDHLCFTRIDGCHYHDLLPLPYTEDALQRVVERVARVQDFLGRAIAVENVSSYVRYRDSAMDEGAFLAALSARSGCGLLVDVNNAFVSGSNHGTDAETFLAALPSESVWEVHLGGYETTDTLLIDAHNNRVSEPVWALYRSFLERVPGPPTLIEWDNNIPAFEVLQQEAAHAQALQTQRERVREQC